MVVHNQALLNGNQKLEMVRTYWNKEILEIV